MVCTLQEKHAFFYFFFFLIDFYFLSEKALSYLRENPPSFVEVAQEWVKFLLRVFEKPHLRAVPRVGDLSFAEKICNEAIDILEKEVAAKSFVEAPQVCSHI